MIVQIHSLRTGRIAHLTGEIHRVAEVPDDPFDPGFRVDVSTQKESVQIRLSFEELIVLRDALVSVLGRVPK